MESDKFLKNVFGNISATAAHAAHGSKAEEWEAALIITGTAVGAQSAVLCAAGVFPALAFLLSRTGFFSGRRWFSGAHDPGLGGQPVRGGLDDSVVRTYLGERQRCRGDHVLGAHQLHAGVAAGEVRRAHGGLRGVRRASAGAGAGGFGSVVNGIWVGRFGAVAAAFAIMFAAFDPSGKINACATAGCFSVFARARVRDRGGSDLARGETHRPARAPAIGDHDVCRSDPPWWTCAAGRA